MSKTDRTLLFDTRVQELKYLVIKGIIEAHDSNSLINATMKIQKDIVPGPRANMRCCIYKERAIVAERVHLAMGGDKSNPNVIEVIDIACDECPIEGIFVTPACRGCLSHLCREACPVGAISTDNRKAVVDKNKCVECGKCSKACPYGAIIMQVRPCVASCKVNAITFDEYKKAVVNNDKCISCGACVYQCPFGAISEKSMILEVLDILEQSKRSGSHTYAVIAPSIVSQFSYAKIEQAITGIRQLGFYQVVEAALGADIALFQEIEEFKHKGTMTTSCCPSFVRYVEKFFPELKDKISSTLSPMVLAAELIKKTDPTAKVVFIGPCISKKMEYKLEKTRGLIDSVMTFEELQAFFDARQIDVSSLEESVLDNASFYGRIFAKSGGIAEGVATLSPQYGVTNISPAAMNGIQECKTHLTLARLNKSKNNFFEGMACEGGCINGPACLNHHVQKSSSDVDKYGQQAKEKSIDNSVKLFKL